jgi:competence protein ComEC
LPLEFVVCFVMDDIRRKLELIDRQLTGPNFHERIISTCPLVFAAVGLIIGIIIQDLSGTSARIWLVSLVLPVSAAVFLFVTPKFSSAARYVTAYLALASFACLGAIRLTAYSQPEPNDISNFVADEPKLATIRGFVITEPYVNKYTDWEFAPFKPGDPTSSFYLKVTEVENVAGWAAATGTVRVQVGEPVLDLQAGDNIQAYCWLDRFRPPTNPGQFDIAAYLARRNILVGVYIESRDGIELLQSSPRGAFAKLITRIRRAATTALVGDLPQEETSRGLIQALLLGYRRDIDSDTYEAFRKTGLLHIISLSGMHFAILIGCIWWFCKAAGLLKTARSAVCLTSIAVFLLVVPPAAPTVRAAIMSAIFCASFFFRRRSSSYNSLALSAIVLLLIRPTQLFEADWQLSFIALLGILLFTERLENLLHRITISRFMTGRADHGALITRVIKYLGGQLIKAFSVGLAAWLGSAGVLLLHFGTITPLASLWTVLISPLVSAIMTLGFLKIILSFLLPSLSAVLGIAVTILTNWLISLTELFSHVEFSEILIGHVSVVPVILYYCLIIFVPFAYFRRPFLKPAVAMVMLFVLVCWLGVLKLQRVYRDDLALTCLDVGHGQAILVRLTGKANVLFDAGSLYGNDVGARIVSPYLDYIGIRNIDALIISHNDADHINGVPEVVEHCNVKSVFANNAFFDRKDEWGTAEFLNNCLIEKGLEIKRIEPEMSLSSSASIKILWPDEQLYNKENLSDNDRALVSLIEFAGKKILLCSDIEEFAQRELLRLYPNLKANIVVVPHHGSTTTLDLEFLKHLEADVLICSCGRRQYEKNDSDPESRKYFPADARLLCTPEAGAVTVSIDKSGVIKTETFVK